MNSYIFISAIILFVLQCIAIVGIPFLMGKPRKPYGINDWFHQLISIALMIPILGRIFGWW